LSGRYVITYRTRIRRASLGQACQTSSVTLLILPGGNDSGLWILTLIFCVPSGIFADLLYAALQKKVRTGVC
jgi:hypothetical protein